MTSDTKPKLTDAEKLLLMLRNWEKPERRGVMLPGTQMTCGHAAAAIRAAIEPTPKVAEDGNQ